MQFTAEQKSQLAKLMATENLTVEHQKIQTARFDPQNRVLYLPIWQNMTGALYDLLCGHEVGHALYTPAQGWHDAVVDESKPKQFKSFLNVVEDARIEKKVKRKYPGLTKQFKDAYNDLMKRDFFGLRDRDVNKMAFIERLNIYTKSQYTMPIQFSAQEEILVKKVQACETWEDVVRVTNEVYAYSKDEQYEMMLQDFQSFDYSDEYGDSDYDTDFDMDNYGDEYDESDSIESKSGKNGEDSNEEADKENDGDGNGEETDKQSKSKSDTESSDGQGQTDESEETEGNGEFNRYKESQPATRDMFNPKCETDDNYRANEALLLDEKCKEYVYLTIPKPILKNIVTPAKRVQEQLTKYYQYEVTERYLSPESVKTWVNDFKTKNDRYIGLLAKEFEMRKAAKAFSKSKLSDTGDIDINKLASYRFDDNIFRKVMLTPKGKNHGLVLLLDKSGSMSNNMSGSIEQILVLAMFCRKVNIPFIVLGFGDSVEAHMEDLNINQHNYDERMKYTSSKYQSFETPIKSLGLGQVFLREYLNNKMTNAEFNSALRNMVLLKKSFEGGRYARSCGRPESEHLSNTPLNSAIVATAEVMKNFKASNNLDMTSLVIVHDGDADYVNYYNVEREETDRDGMMVKRMRYQSMDPFTTNVVLRDSKNNFEVKMKPTRNREEMTVYLLSWFRKVTGAKVFGFFLIPDSRPSWVRGTISHRYVMEDGKTYSEKFQEAQKSLERWQEQQAIELQVKELAKKFKTEKFLVSNTPGFNSFFLVAGGDDLKTEDEEIEIEGKVTANKLKTAFMKMNKKKQINRVLVSKFIQGIAA
jgi:hypothetical protein